MTTPDDHAPEALLEASPADQRRGDEPQDLLKITEEEKAERDDRSMTTPDDHDPEALLEASLADQRRGDEPQDLLKITDEEKAERAGEESSG